MRIRIAAHQLKGEHSQTRNEGEGQQDCNALK
jgi:hypothetical protein